MLKTDIIAEIQSHPSYDGAKLDDMTARELRILLSKYRSIPQGASKLREAAHFCGDQLYIAVSATPFGGKYEEIIVEEISQFKKKKIDYHYNTLKEKYANEDYYIGAFDESDSDFSWQRYRYPFYWEKTKKD